MVMSLPVRFLRKLKENGPKEAVQATSRYTDNKADRLQEILQLYRIRLSAGSWDIIRNINDSRMKLNNRPNSPNKIERTLAIDGIRERGATNIFSSELYRLKEKEFSKIHVFDIGANIGYFSLLEANILGDDGEIYAIEAEPNNAERLAENISINDYSNVEVWQIAAGAERTELELSRRSSSNIHRMTDVLDDKTSMDTINVDVRPIDSLIAEKEIGEEELILVRMDIEGYEGHAFNGMSKLLNSDRPAYIFAELHPGVEAINLVEIADTLSQSGFHPEYISFDGGDTYQEMDSLEEVKMATENCHVMVSRC